MTRLRHPLSGTEYFGEDDGTVTVVGSNGKSGRFTRAGDWISGERRTADAQLCLWVSDGAVQKRRNREEGSTSRDMPMDSRFKLLMTSKEKE
jgi:hypothetical protein